MGAGTFLHCLGRSLALGPGVLVVPLPRPLPPTPIPRQTSTALHRAACAPGLCVPTTACRGHVRASGREGTEGKTKASPKLPVSASRRQNHPRQPSSQLGGMRPLQLRHVGGEAQATWPQGAKPSKIHLLRVRADNTCPLPTSRGLGVLPPGGALPSPGVQHTSGVLTTPGSLTLGALNPGPRASWPRPSSWSHRGAGVGAGLGDWWPVVRSSGVEWGPHLHRTNANS